MKWRTPAIGVLLGVAVAVGVFIVVDSEEPSATPTRTGCLIGAQIPCSAEVELGKAYRYQVPHCGLIWIVDFDKSHWDVDEASMTEEENGRFGINSDEGTMTLEKEDLAVYRSFRGGEATLRRHVGPWKSFACA